jgi:hypothetical protein
MEDHSPGKVRCEEEEEEEEGRRGRRLLVALYRV